MSKLDPEEKEILEAFESGKLKRAKNQRQELARHRKAATATFAKDSRINIRLSSKDLRALQKRALAEGMPYQTLVSSVLHKFVEGQMVEQPANQVRAGISPALPTPPSMRVRTRRLKSGNESGSTDL
jgi:predicted DNA binding CopG/RHH family protein